MSKRKKAPIIAEPFIETPAVDEPIVEAAKTVKAPAPKKETTVIDYGVRRGDTLDSIADKFGTTVAKLVKDNNISKDDQIFGGQRIIVRL